MNRGALRVIDDFMSRSECADILAAIRSYRARHEPPLIDRAERGRSLRYRVIDANNVSHLLTDKKYRKLGGNDSLHAILSFDPKPYPGRNYLFIEANPDNNQPEEYHPNNLGYIPFTVRTDQQNPLLDVTFDGVHILDKDIISPRPFIKVLMRDENKYVGLSDTSMMKLYVRYPSDGPGVRRLASISSLYAAS